METLLSQSTGKTDEKSDNKAYSRNDIEGTPLVEIYSEQDGGYFIVMGNHRLSPVRDEESHKEAVEKLKTIPWTELIPILGVMIEAILETRGKDQTKGGWDA